MKESEVLCTDSTALALGKDRGGGGGPARKATVSFQIPQIVLQAASERQQAYFQLSRQHPVDRGAGVAHSVGWLR
jgi:hypothetical protein